MTMQPCPFPVTLCDMPSSEERVGSASGGVRRAHTLTRLIHVVPRHGMDPIQWRINPKLLTLNLPALGWCHSRGRGSS